MSKRRTFGDDTPAPEQASNGKCQAHNCQLPGTISHSTTGPHVWTCWVHDRCKEPGQWPYLTNGIAENQWLFSLLARCVEMSPYDFDKKRGEVFAYLSGRGRPDLVQSEKESRSAWLRRIRQASYAAAMDYVNEHWSRAA